MQLLVRFFGVVFTSAELAKANGGEILKGPIDMDKRGRGRGRR